MVLFQNETFLVKSLSFEEDESSGETKVNKLKFICAFILLLGAANAWCEPYSILQGTTSETTTHFTVVAEASEILSFKVVDANGGSTPVESERVAYQGSDYVVYRLHANGLSLQKDYKLQVLANGQIADSRSFGMLDTKKRDGRLAFGSCMVRQLHNPFLWNNLEKPLNRPDALMIIGDIVYLDRPHLWPAHKPQNGLEVWEQFVKARLKENLYYWEKLVPTIALWDDHDSGGDNVNSSQVLIHEVRRIFETFLANDEIPGFIQHGPGLAKKFRLFDKNFVMLDGRSFRNRNSSHPAFGSEQDRWLLESLEEGPNFIVSGSQFYGGPLKKDSLEFNWPEFAKVWTRTLREQAQDKNATLAFLSGDVHFSEVEDLEPELFGYRTVEVTSSNIHSFGAPGHYLLKPANPRRRVVTGTHNIVLLEFSKVDEGFGFIARSMGWRGNDLFRTIVSIGSPMRIVNAPANACEEALTL